MLFRSSFARIWENFVVMDSVIVHDNVPLRSHREIVTLFANENIRHSAQLKVFLAAMVIERRFGSVVEGKQILSIDFVYAILRFLAIPVAIRRNLIQGDSLMIGEVLLTDIGCVSLFTTPTVFLGCH